LLSAAIASGITTRPRSEVESTEKTVPSLPFTPASSPVEGRRPCPCRKPPSECAPARGVRPAKEEENRQSRSSRCRKERERTHPWLSDRNTFVANEDRSDGYDDEVDEAGGEERGDDFCAPFHHHRPSKVRTSPPSKEVLEIELLAVRCYREIRQRSIYKKDKRGRRRTLDINLSDFRTRCPQSVSLLNDFRTSSYAGVGECWRVTKPFLSVREEFAGRRGVQARVDNDGSRLQGEGKEVGEAG
jgi:hypothetical protein